MTNPITAVTREVARHEELKKTLQALYEDLDPQALIDTLEGETDLSEALQQVASQALDYEALAAATKARKDALGEREARLNKSAETLRTIVLQAIITTGSGTIAGPEMTLAPRKTPPALVIDDESLVPSEYFKSRDPVIDKDKLKAALEAAGEDEEIPGAHLSNGGISLTIRVK